jgi:hypothetical protein
MTIAKKIRAIAGMKNPTELRGESVAEIKAKRRIAAPRPNATLDLLSIDPG